MTSDPIATVETQLFADGPVIARALDETISQSDMGQHLVPVMADYRVGAAKLLRPVLCLATCRSFGGNAANAIGAGCPGTTRTASSSGTTSRTRH